MVVSCISSTNVLVNKIGVSLYFIPDPKVGVIDRLMGTTTGGSGGPDPRNLDGPPTSYVDI